uniref:Sperm associated antigen 6 n=1 Tax=Sinocyclocheilus grahami TaxID=75366 RepID=A0A672KEM6_SINGR
MTLSERPHQKYKTLSTEAATFVLRAVAKHSPELAQAVVDCGALDALVISLEEFDPGVKEAAAWAIGYIARHNAQLSQAVVDAGVVPLLVLCIQEPEIALKRVAASALSDIAKHTPELAQTVVDTGAIAHLAQMILNPDAKLKRQVFSALSQIAKHSVDVAEMVVEAEIFPAALVCLKDPDEYVQKNVATLIREITKHTPETGVMAAENLGVPQLAICLEEEQEDHIKAATAWSFGQIGRHTPEHAKAVAVANVLPKLLNLYLDTESSEDLQVKAKKALKSILQKCTYLPALEPLLYEAPSNILKHVICQFSKVLPHDSKARRLFVTSGGLKKVQEIKAEPGSAIQEYINAINSCYPEEIVRYYSPGYSETLLERIDNYQPV